MIQFTFIWAHHDIMLLFSLQPLIHLLSDPGGGFQSLPGRFVVDAYFVAQLVLICRIIMSFARGASSMHIHVLYTCV